MRESAIKSVWRINRKDQCALLVSCEIRNYRSGAFFKCIEADHGFIGGKLFYLAAPGILYFIGSAL
jgi:hypothetical protein